ncbi:hypothetical protein RB195_024541 [Necator americanus]|uniref:Uncharacterized protein n=1 Tax=Necator americanus TaxID=51031 RepID=A0ABR1ENR4_NECAM
MNMLKEKLRFFHIIIVQNKIKIPNKCAATGLANRTSDNGDHLVDLCEQTVSSSLARVRGIIDAITSPGRVNPYNACRAVQVEDEDS